MDAFAFVMLAVELERKKRAFVSWRDALRGTDLNSKETTNATITPLPQSHYEELRTDSGKPKTVP